MATVHGEGLTDEPAGPAAEVRGVVFEADGDAGGASQGTTGRRSDDPVGTSAKQAGVAGVKVGNPRGNAALELSFEAAGVRDELEGLGSAGGFEQADGFAGDCAVVDPGLELGVVDEGDAVAIFVGIGEVLEVVALAVGAGSVALECGLEQARLGGRDVMGGPMEACGLGQAREPPRGVGDGGLQAGPTMRRPAGVRLSWLSQVRQVSSWPCCQWGFTCRKNWLWASSRRVGRGSRQAELRRTRPRLGS